MSSRFDIYADDGSRDVDRQKVKREISRIIQEYAHGRLTINAMACELEALCDDVAHEAHDQGYQEAFRFARGLKWD